MPTFVPATCGIIAIVKKNRALTHPMSLNSIKSIKTPADAMKFLNKKTDVSKAHPTTSQLQREARGIVTEMKVLEKCKKVSAAKKVSWLLRVARFSKKVIKQLAIDLVFGATSLQAYIGILYSLEMMNSGIKTILFWGRDSIMAHIMGAHEQIFVGSVTSIVSLAISVVLAKLFKYTSFAKVVQKKQPTNKRTNARTPTKVASR